MSLVNVVTIRRRASIPTVPRFSMGEVGTVSDTTVRVWFNRPINSPALGYDAGVVINVDASPATINSATRQTNQALVHYVLSAAVTNGQAVTFQYTAASGDIENQLAVPEALGNVAETALTNNVMTGMQKLDFSESTNSEYLFLLLLD